MLGLPLTALGEGPGQGGGAVVQVVPRRQDGLQGDDARYGTDRGRLLRALARVQSEPAQRRTDLGHAAAAGDGLPEEVMSKER